MWRGTKEFSRWEWKRRVKKLAWGHGIPYHHFMANRSGKGGNRVRFYFLGLQNHCRQSLQPWHLKTLAPCLKVMTNLDSILKSRDITLPTKMHLIKAIVFSRNHVWMWELDHKQGWAPKNWCFQIVVLEKTLASPLEISQESKPVHPKVNQPWIFIWRTDAEAEALIFWPPDEKSQLIAKDPDAGKDWGQKEKEVQRMRWLAPPTQWSWIWANSRR